MAAGAQEGSIRFRRFAEECIHIADRIESVDDKAALLIMAQERIRLADQDTIMEQPQQARVSPRALPARIKKHDEQDPGEVQTFGLWGKEIHHYRFLTPP